MADKRRIETGALLLPLLGFVLFVPPFTMIFGAPTRLFGLPLELLYVFCVVAGLIAMTARMGPLLQKAERARSSPEQAKPPSSGASAADEEERA